MCAVSVLENEITYINELCKKMKSGDEKGFLFV